MKLTLKTLRNMGVAASFATVAYFAIVANGKAQQLWVVDVETLIREMVADINTPSITKTEIEEELKARIKRMEYIIEDIAQKNKKTIINKKATIAGGIDVTGMVRTEVTNKKW